MLNSQARRRCSLVRATLNTTLLEDPREVLFPGLMGKQRASFLSARGVLGSFQNNSAPSGNTRPLVEAVHRPRFSGTRKTQKLSSSTSLNTAKSNLGLENIQSRCNQTDIPTVFPLNFMNKWRKMLPWVTQPLVVPSKKNELQGTYTTNQRNGLHRNTTLLLKLGGKV